MKSILYIFYSIVLCLAFASRASAQLIIPNAGQWDKEIIAEINSGEATMLLTETGLIDRTDYTIGNTPPIVPMKNVKIQAIVIDSSKYFNYFVGNNPANYRSKVYPFGVAGSYIPFTFNIVTPMTNAAAYVDVSTRATAASASRTRSSSPTS